MKYLIEIPKYYFFLLLLQIELERPENVRLLYNNTFKGLFYISYGTYITQRFAYLVQMLAM